jgi:hypothetical protein
MKNLRLPRGPAVKPGKVLADRRTRRRRGRAAQKRAAIKEAS